MPIFEYVRYCGFESFIRQVHFFREITIFDFIKSIKKRSCECVGDRTRDLLPGNFATTTFFKSGRSPLTTMSRSKNCSNSIGLRNPHSFLSAVYFSVIVNLSSFDYYDFYFTYKDKMT